MKRVDEIVEYTEQSDGRTLASRRVSIRSEVLGFSSAICNYAAERFKTNCVKTAVGFNHVLKRMFPDHVPNVNNIHISGQLSPMSVLKSRDAIRLYMLKHSKIYKYLSTNYFKLCTIYMLLS